MLCRWVKGVGLWVRGWITWTNPRKLTGITVDYAVHDAADSQSLDIILGYVWSMAKTFFFSWRKPHCFTKLAFWSWQPKMYSVIHLFWNYGWDTKKITYTHSYHEVSLNIANTSSSLSTGIMSSNVNAAEYSWSAVVFRTWKLCFKALVANKISVRSRYQEPTGVYKNWNVLLSI